MYRVGDVVWYLSDDVEAAGKNYGKGKYILCVAVSERWYFFINSSGRFADSFRITRADFGELPNPRALSGVVVFWYCPTTTWKSGRSGRSVRCLGKLFAGLSIM